MMQCSGLTWALIRHDQALRASLTVPARTPLRPGLSPSCSPEQYETLSTRRLGHRLATSELPRSGRRIDTTYCAKKRGEPPGLAARIGPGDHRPGAVPRRQRDRLRAQLLAMGGLRRRRPARSTAVWQVRSLVCGDRCHRRLWMAGWECSTATPARSALESSRR